MECIVLFRVLWTAFEWLEDNHHIESWRIEKLSPKIWCEKHNIKLFCIGYDVKRKKDLNTGI